MDGTFLQGFIVSFREGLEAFLIMVILLKFLDKTNNKKFKISVWQGAFIGVMLSILIGFLLFFVSKFFNSVDSTTQLWESLSSIFAVILITGFIIWMIKHGNSIKSHIEKKANKSLSKKGIFLLALIMVAREGAEIAIFSFAGKYGIFPIMTGILCSIALVFLINNSIVKVKLHTIFKITLIYLILQAGFLLGYGIHEGLSALKNLNYIDDSSSGKILLSKAFDFSGTILNHKEGIVGLPLYVLFGWYSKPEWIQVISQYSYTLLLLGYWFFVKRKIYV